MRLKMICFCSPVLHYDQENEQYRRGKVTWQDSSDDEWRLSALQAIRERFDEKLWRGKGEPKFDKQHMRNAFFRLIAPIAGHFQPRRHRMSAQDYRATLQNRFQVWDEVTGVKQAA